MIEVSSKKLDLKKKNDVILKTIELDTNLTCFILVDTDEKKFSEIILGRLIDNIIGKISKDSAYKDLSIALENTNSIIKSWRQEGGIDGELSIIIAILNEKDIIFSTIGTPSCYLVKKDKEVLEITDKDENKKEFLYISNGDIGNEELIIMCSDRLLHHISRSDILDSIDVSNVDDITNNIEVTLREEKIDNNIGFIVIRNSYYKEASGEKMFCVNNFFYKLLDNNFVKKTMALYMLAKDKILLQKKSIRSVILFLGIIVSFFILFSTVSSIVTKTGKAEVINDYKKDLQNTKDLVKLAAENISNQAVFSENLRKAEDTLDILREKKLFLSDLEKIEEDINTIKKQFNLVETFEERTDNLVYKGLPSGTTKILNLKGALYTITNNSVVGPIIGGKNPKEYVYKEIGKDSFVDIVAIDSDIFLVTKNGMIISFDKTGFFKKFDVKGQAKWEDFKYVKTYNSFLYTLSSGSNQIYKHKKFGDSFEKGTPYIEEQDIKNHSNIMDIALDGGIYLLKKDLTMVKVFRSPIYRIERLTLNKLPKNYDVEPNSTPPRIIVGSKLKYVYLFLNNRIRVFRTNSPNFNQTKTLTYVGQIDGVDKIIDFNIYRDGEAFILNKNGIFRVNFEVSDNKLILK
ncbi:hypothetical protein EOM39_05655 [Candidatus Gracilibacteria bacterium]|nr:hypothetical protein [Candidatus Gracilibacteria bacterium]